MHIRIPFYTFPTDLDPTENAVAYLAWIGADVWDYSTGRVTLWISRSFEVANQAPDKAPSDQIHVEPGKPMAPGVIFPTIEQLDATAHALSADHPELSPMKLLGLAIYLALLDHPQLAGATFVP